MQCYENISPLRSALSAARTKGKTVGFVPTMGCLHQGHLSLVELARKHADEIVVSIFINPLQFNDKNDLLAYPVSLERDRELLDGLGVHALFLPSTATIYPGRHEMRVMPGQLADPMEGASRPGHFEGVTTVVAILFNIVRPDVAVFGEKDFQQLRIIEQMVEDLQFDMTIVRGPTLREDDGLAMSSRNVRLSPEGRKKAPLLFQALSEGASIFRKGCHEADRIEERVVSCLGSDPAFKVEYVVAADEATLRESPRVNTPARLFGAVRLEEVRLIDNVKLG